MLEKIGCHFKFQKREVTIPNLKENKLQFQNPENSIEKKLQS